MQTNILFNFFYDYETGFFFFLLLDKVYCKK